jgi:hypothetical protein
MSIIEQIRKIQTLSATAWELAVDTAGPEYAGGSRAKAKAMKHLADSCDAEYDAAIECLEGRNADLARQHLESARSLESEGGDDSHAEMALKVLDGHSRD